MGGSRGAVRAPVRPWRPSVGAVARRGPRRLGDRRWGRPRAWFAAGVDASATGGGLSRSDKLHATGASAARRARPGRATTRLMRPPPFAVGSGRRTSGGGRAPAGIASTGGRIGERNPSFGERPAVSKGTTGAAPYAGEKSGSRITGYSRVHPGRTHAYRGRSGTWWSKAVRETGVPAQRWGAATAGSTAPRQPPARLQRPSVDFSGENNWCQTNQERI